ncbi:hypothetical protein [Rathayibacter sp. VKM Ac-2928]|uniref:hypothetical protein n=1 Tax=Rathayibacter sp. VKM Ac-2928 TaxID=2929479 RepID=UPI001FB2AB7C|nr:hypothetical protein [Rathayibacter sp. VKM Ac-2928]MCJ1682334.1 hypothetical protein [Rathayibacter sp. VKM Ac-2928]
MTILASLQGRVETVNTIDEDDGCIEVDDFVSVRSVGYIAPLCPVKAHKLATASLEAADRAEHPTPDGLARQRGAGTALIAAFLLSMNVSRTPAEKVND